MPRTDLCGGRSVMIVPTASVGRLETSEHSLRTNHRGEPAQSVARWNTESRIVAAPVGQLRTKCDNRHVQDATL
jgi:hypothetical protein